MSFDKNYMIIPLEEKLLKIGEIEKFYFLWKKNSSLIVAFKDINHRRSTSTIYADIRITLMTFITSVST